jgi:RHS repeat-associated protein
LARSRRRRQPTRPAALSYDPAGRLYQTSASGIAATRLLYDGAALIGEYDVSGALLRRYVYGPDGPIVWYEGAGISDRRWLITDQLGSIAAVTNASGAVTAVNAYDEYGQPGPSNTGRMQFAGQPWIPEVSFYQMGARAYAPAIGRFLQSDPILTAGGMNIYAYVGNDPVNRIDPWGLQQQDEGIVVTAWRDPCAARLGCAPLPSVFFAGPHADDYGSTLDDGGEDGIVVTGQRPRHGAFAINFGAGRGAGEDTQCSFEEVQQQLLRARSLVGCVSAGCRQRGVYRYGGSNNRRSRDS